MKLSIVANLTIRSISALYLLCVCSMHGLYCRFFLFLFSVFIQTHTHAPSLQLQQSWSFAENSSICLHLFYCCSPSFTIQILNRTYRQSSKVPHQLCNATCANNTGTSPNSDMTPQAQLFSLGYFKISLHATIVPPTLIADFPNSGNRKSNPLSFKTILCVKNASSNIPTTVISIIVFCFPSRTGNVCSPSLASSSISRTSQLVSRNQLYRTARQKLRRRRSAELHCERRQ